MKNNLSIAFEMYQENIRKAYPEIMNVVEETEKVNKKVMYKFNKLNEKRLRTITDGIKFFYQKDTTQLTKLFLFESLDISKEQNISTFVIINLKYLDVSILLKDKEFVIFLKYIMNIDLMYKTYFNSNPTKTNFTEYLKMYFSVIRSIFFAYFIIQEKNLTLNKIKNITSYVLENSELQGESELNEKQVEILNQIKSGVKYEKIKVSANNTYSNYRQIKRFNILEKAKHTIRIKYVSDKEYKHNTHKSPREHDREGYFRHYPNGKRIWIKPTVVNRGVA